MTLISVRYELSSFLRLVQYSSEKFMIVNFEVNLTTRHCRTADWQKAKAWIENSPRDEAFFKVVIYSPPRSCIC